jgi:hypothetical protein
MYTQKYYLDIKDFIGNIITIPSSNFDPNSTNTSLYFAGRANVYDASTNKESGICSASFLCMNDNTNIYVDISNYLSLKNGLIISWFTPSTPLNLEIDSIVNGMVTEAIVKASTKIGINPYFGKNFLLKVSSDNGKIYFDLTQCNSV